MPTDRLPTFKLSHVSEARKQFLLRWRLERKLDLALRIQQPKEASLGTATEAGIEHDFAIRPFDKSVCAGDIRLLRKSDIQDPNRLLYVLVLYVRNENLTSVVVPFSTYSVPCCKDEWLSGIEGEPLKVLQFWNAQPVPTFSLAMSWVVDTFDEDRLEVAKMLYRHAIAGTWPQGKLREKVGLAILNPNDERLVYQHEELSHFEKLRGRLASLQETAVQQVKRKVVFDTKGAFTIGKEKTTFIQPERWAASSGSTFAEVHFCQDDKVINSIRATRETISETRTICWKLKLAGNKDFLLPGLPACLYGNQTKKVLLATGQTENDGSLITFQVNSSVIFKRILKSECVRILICLPRKDD